MPRKRRPGRPRKHGGRRPNQTGRPPIAPGGTQDVSVTLTAKHIAKVERWEQAHDSGSFSAAVRDIIDTAPE